MLESSVHLLSPFGLCILLRWEVPVHAHSHFIFVPLPACLPRFYTFSLYGMTLCHSVFSAHDFMGGCSLNMPSVPTHIPFCLGVLPAPPTHRSYPTFTCPCAFTPPHIFASACLPRLLSFASLYFCRAHHLRFRTGAFCARWWHTPTT